MDFFTADLHFFHRNIIEYCNRPYTDVSDMNQSLVQNWNDRVGLLDTVWLLGDVSFGKPGETLELLANLRGKINLIPGNHDRKGRCSTQFLKVRCNVYPEYFLYRGFGKKFVLCHFPFASWERGWINLHGHTHGTHPSKWRQHDVGVDVNHYFPISVEEAFERATNKPVEELY